MTVVIHAPPFALPGLLLQVSVECLDDAGARLAWTGAPTLRIYRVLESGTQEDALAASSATQYMGQNAFFRTWTPARTGVYMIEAHGTVAAQPVEGTRAVSVPPLGP